MAFQLLNLPSGRCQVPEKILVIDDNQDHQEIFRMLLRHLGYEVIQATSAASGMDKAASEHPDLILLDLVMPYMSGGQLVARLKSSPSTRDIPVIICTASMSDYGSKEAIRHGAAEILMKPISKTFLAEILRRHLAPKTKHTELDHRR